MAAADDLGNDPNAREGALRLAGASGNLTGCVIHLAERVGVEP